MRPGVSFVIPVFNGEKWLARSLDAILAQGADCPLEVIDGMSHSQHTTR